MACDLGALGKGAQGIKTERERLFNQAADLKLPIGKACGQLLLIVAILRIDRTIAAKVGRYRVAWIFGRKGIAIR